MTTEPSFEALLARAHRLTPAGVRRAMPDGPADERGQSFRQLLPTGKPRFAPATGDDLAVYCARELDLMLRFPPRTRPARTRSDLRRSIPTVVPIAITELVRMENVRAIPVSDEAVLAGRCPVSWLTAIRELSRRQRWIDALLEAQRIVLDLLADARPHMDVAPIPSRIGNRFKIDTVMAAEEDGLTALAHGRVATSVGADGISLGRTRAFWLTVELSWTEVAQRDLPALPAPRGTLIVQAMASQALTGLLREHATGAARLAVCRAQLRPSDR